MTPKEVASRYYSGDPHKRQCLEQDIAAAFAALREECANELPTNWLNPLLTGPKAVVGKPPYGCPDIERLCKAIAERIRTAKPAKAQEGA
jgi:hypothetical protein